MTDDRGDPEDRSPIDDKDWDAAPSEGEGDENVEDKDEKVASDRQQEQGEPFRVEEDIGPRIPVWTGVRSCSDASRAVAEMTPHFEAWVRATIAKHPNNTATAKGYYNGRFWWKNRSVNGKRRCKGGFHTLMVYVDFI